jgi:hypothetical protein
METFHNLASHFHIFSITIYLFAALLLVAVAGNELFIKKGKIHENFITVRSLAEALRIQYYLLLAGINEPITNRFLRKHRGDLSWLKIVLNNIFFITRENKISNQPNIQLVKNEWIDGQIAYYKSKILDREKKAESLEWRESFMYKAGMIGVFVVIVLLSMMHSGAMSEHLVEKLEHISLPHIFLLNFRT